MNDNPTFPIDLFLDILIILLGLGAIYLGSQLLWQSPILGALTILAGGGNIAFGIFIIIFVKTNV